MIMTHGRVYICFFKLFYLLSVFLVFFSLVFYSLENHNYLGTKPGG